ncbi:tyrosine-type recombinase/integrase [Shewanella vesiculosa]|uniref:tyrosine-type recombinase/integrase n=1 Tax=Shewanella vesiculosa TaxID=518738 RepID=UPI00384A9141
MKTKFKFTNANINALPANPSDAKSTELEFSDSVIIGLKCLSGKTGNKRWSLRYTLNGRKGSISLGRFPEIDVAAARNIAKKHKVQIAQGFDPKTLQEGRKGIPTVGEFFEQTYLPTARNRKKSWADDAQRFRDFCKPISSIRYDDLKAVDIQQIQNDIMNPKRAKRVYAAATCNRVLALIKTIGALSERLLDIPNVAARVPKLPENNARMRFCSVDEVRRIIKEALGYHHKQTGAYVAMLFLTGCRASEMRYRTWSDINYEQRTITIEKTKNGTQHVLYLTGMMLTILANIPRVAGNNYIFAGTKPNRPISEGRWAFDIIKTRAGIENPNEVVFHTARHSIASNLLSHAETTHADIRSVQELLNHKSIQSTMRYAKLSIQRKRQTSESMEALLNCD